MKILVLTHEYAPFPGGVAHYMYELLRRFNADEYIVCTDQSEISEAIPVQRVRLLSSIVRPRWIAGFFRVASVVRDKKPSVIFTPHILPLGIIAFYIKRFFGVPYVISLHGLDINWALKKKRRMTRKILSNAHHIITNSEMTASFLTPLQLKTPISIITPSAADTRAQVQEDLVKRYKDQFKGKQVVITIGRLVERKGQDTVINAFAQLVSEFPNAQYVIAGDGPYRIALERLVEKHGLQKHVSMLGRISNDERNALYSVADVFAMPSRNINGDVEGFGIVYLEAAQWSIPLVVGSAGGEEDAVGKDGEEVLRVDGESISDVQGALASLLRDTSFAKQIGEAGKRHAAALPSWNEQSSKLKKILTV